MSSRLSKLAFMATFMLAFANAAQAAYTVHFKKPASWTNVYLSTSCLLKDSDGDFVGAKASEKQSVSKYGWVDVDNFEYNSASEASCFYTVDEDGLLAGTYLLKYGSTIKTVIVK